MKSKAAVLQEPGILQIEEFLVPEGDEEDGLLKVEITGVCGSDWPAFSVGLDLYEMPCIMGHEIVGRIERVGKRAKERWGVETGDRVAVEEYLPCGLCESCLEGYYQMCAEKRYGGRSISEPPALWGGFSEYMYLHPRTLLHRFKQDVPRSISQLFIPISNGIYWVQEVGGVGVGDTVVIQGPGPHGLGCVIGAKEAGAGKIIVIGLESDSRRLEVARELGADMTLMADSDDVVEAVAAVTEGAMARTVINLANSPLAVEQSLDLAGQRGTILKLGLASRSCSSFDSDKIVYKALTMKGVRGRPSRYVPIALRLIESGRYNLAALCTHEFDIAHTEDAIRLVGDPPSDLIRTSVVCS